MTEEKMRKWKFDDVMVEPSNFKVFKAESEVQLEPKTFRLLLFLLENRGRLVEKGELLDVIWKDAFVTENALTREVAKLRNGLGDDSKTPKYIQTVHTKGYRFIAEVEEIPAHNDAADDAAAGRSERGYLDQALNIKAEDTNTSEALKARRPIRNSLVASAFLILLLFSGLVWWIFAYGSKSSEIPVIARTSQVTSWSGLDFYPSISADGNTLAFSSDRSGNFEIYIKQFVAGAREVQLTSDGGQNFEPAFSPDGTVIAYHSKKRGGIWVVPVSGGSPKQIVEFGTHPAWSPDATRIAFQTDPLNDLGSGVRNAMTPSTIWIVPSKGGEPKQLTQVGNPAGGHGAPTWSPDGQTIAFDVGDWATSKIWTISTDGKNLRNISPNIFSAGDPVFGPDGKSVYFIDGTGLSISQINLSATGEPVGEPLKLLDASGTRIRQLSFSARKKRIVYAALSTNSNILETSLSANVEAPTGDPISLTQNSYTRTVRPAFSPDGKKIAFQCYTTGMDVYIWVMDSDGKNRTQLTSETGYDPWWFPDGKNIAYSWVRDGQSSFGIMNLDSGVEKKLFDFDDETPIARLSPDGKRVAFSSKKSGVVNLWISPVEGGEPKQLTFDKELAGFPAWSPDGKWIAFELKRGDDTSVAIVPSSGGEPIQLTDEKGQSWAYDWSPDGEKVIYAGQRDGMWNVYSVSRTTGAVRQLTNFTKLNSYVRYPAWSPLNDKIAYEYSETTGNIWMVELK